MYEVHVRNIWTIIEPITVRELELYFIKLI